MSGALLDAAVRASLLLAPALLFALGSRRSSAAVRHAACFAAIGAALVLPPLGSLLPEIRLAVLPVLVPAAGTKVALPSGDWANSFLGGLWLLGALAFGARILGGVSRAHALCHRASPVSDARVLSAVIRVRRELGLTTPIRVLSQRRLAMPFTWGILRPVVLLPRGAKDWSRGRLRAVLLHELSHVRRRDCLTQLVADLACAIYWFHPLVWLAALRMRVERERACDDTVVVVGGRPSGYAVLLLRMVKGIHAGARPARLSPAATFADGGGLTGRLRALLGRARDRRSLTPAAAVAFALGALTLALPVAAVRLTRQLPSRPLPVPYAASAVPAPLPRPDPAPIALPAPTPDPTPMATATPVPAPAVLTKEPAAVETPRPAALSPERIEELERQITRLAGRPATVHPADPPRPRTANVRIGFFGGFSFYVQFKGEPAVDR